MTSPRVRVCQVISSFHPVMGGAEQATLRLSRELVRRGAVVSVLTRRYPGLSRHDDIDGVRVHRAGLPLHGKLGALFFAFHGFLLLATRLRDHKVVHAQGPDVQLLLSLVARVLLGPAHGVHGAFGSPPAASYRARWWRAPVQRREALGGPGSVFWAPTSPESSRRKASPPSASFRLPNGVDMTRFRPAEPTERAELRRELGVEESEVVGVFLGRLVALKRVDLLMRAWLESGAGDRGPLLVAGAGPEEEGLRELATELGSPAIRFLGRTDQPERVLRAADLFILPSQREGQSVALLEAMACGLVPVVSDLEPNVAVVEDGATGFVFATDDQSSLERALRRAAEADRPAISHHAATQVAARNSLAATASTHLALYEQITPAGAVHRAAGRTL